MTAPTIGVCGFGRCGSTMAMAMLRAGGVPFVEGSDEQSGEFDGIQQLLRLRRGALDGRAVKILDFGGRLVLPEANWRFIWLDRDPVEQAKSMAKFAASFRMGDDLDVDKLARSYGRDRPAALTSLRRVGPVLVWDYGRVLAQPLKHARQLALFLAGSPDGRGPVPAGALADMPFDVRLAAGAVHVRDWRCRPDLAFEIGLAQGESA